MLACLSTLGGIRGNLLNFKIWRGRARINGQLRKAYHNESFKNRKELHKALESWNVKIEWTFPHFFYQM